MDEEGTAVCVFFFLNEECIEEHSVVVDGD